MDAKPNPLPEDGGRPIDPAGQSCSTRGGGCPSCGGSRVLLIGLLVFGGIYLYSNRSRPAAPSAVSWVNDYEAGMAQASQAGKPVLLAFKASWCGPCREMDNEVFSKPETAKALAGWVPVHIDVDEQPKIAAQYKVNGVPAFVALTPQGQFIDSHSGGMDLREFAEFLASAQAKAGTATSAAK